MDLPSPWPVLLPLSRPLFDALLFGEEGTDSLGRPFSNEELQTKLGSSRSKKKKESTTKKVRIKKEGVSELGW